MLLLDLRLSEVLSWSIFFINDDTETESIVCTPGVTSLLGVICELIIADVIPGSSVCCD